MRHLANVVGLGILLATSVRLAWGADTPPQAMVLYVAFPTMHADAPLTVAGRLMIPRSARRAPGKPPVVVILHGSAGVDTRGPLMANALLQVGIATLEIDMWTPRRLRDGVKSVPRPAIDTLPDAFGALTFLSSFPLIDPARIGITGFSLGGAVSMLTASKPLADQYGPPGLRFRAHAALYPVCWAYNSPRRPQYVFKELTGAPVLIQGGERDTYDEPDTCQKLVESLPDASRQLVRLKMYPWRDAQVRCRGTRARVQGRCGQSGAGRRDPRGPESRGRRDGARGDGEVFRRGVRHRPVEAVRPTGGLGPATGSAKRGEEFVGSGRSGPPRATQSVTENRWSRRYQPMGLAA
jgi:uncharacterized protein